MGLGVRYTELLAGLQPPSDGALPTDDISERFFDHVPVTRRAWVTGLPVGICSRSENRGDNHGRREPSACSSCPLVCVRLTMPSTYPGTPISLSLFSLDSFLTLLSTFNAKLLVPNLFWNTKVKGPLLLRYFDPPSPFPWCWANRRSTAVEIPVYRLPSWHLTMYKYQSDITRTYDRYLSDSLADRSTWM